ncbi:unnamed protein product [Musa acuminata subsp. burmannicoides]
MGWASLYKRRLKVFTTALLIYLDYKAVQMIDNWYSGSRRDDLWEGTHERNAKRVLDLMIQLEGLWVKLGQYLSTRADALPDAYVRLLKQLQDSLPRRPLEEVRQTIEKELGKPMNDIFSHFVEEPLATASVAQVHRATLRDGQDVVVKVQHVGIKEVILEVCNLSLDKMAIKLIRSLHINKSQFQDLKNAKSITDWIAWAEPQYDFNPMIDEWCKEAPKELDFNHEAENTRRVSENLRLKNELDGMNRVDVLIPEIIQSSEMVLVLQYMDGIRLNDNVSLEAYEVDKQKLVEEITRAYAHQIYVDGFFNGDPHPGNFLVCKEHPNRPILLDFGLTKSISSSMKQALAKMFLACAEEDHVALLAAFTMMGLKLRLDMPEQAMNLAKIFFRTAALPSQAFENVQSIADQRQKDRKVIQEKMKLNKKEAKHFNPIDAFPGDAVIFMRVLELLRGLSSTLNVHVVYLDIMRPFAEATLLGGIKTGPAVNIQWIYDSPVHSDLEAKLRQLLIALGSEKILGIQVCAYKDGKVIIDTAAGVMGRYDPRPVHPDTLFPVFSVTQGITAAMVHWLVDKGKLKLDEAIANIWPEFSGSKKDQIKVHHVLNHSSGLHNAMSDVMRSNPLLMCDWEKSLQLIASSVPETEPGSQQLYHHLSFGWLCGGVIEHASGKKFQQLLEEAFIHPLNIEGELYIGIPPGVESRLATLAVDTEDLQTLLDIEARQEMAPPSSHQGNVADTMSSLPGLFNNLNTRRAIIPAANAHCSARALARFYAALANGGSTLPPHSLLSKPPLGSHVHTPTFPPLKRPKKNWRVKWTQNKNSSLTDISIDDGGRKNTRTIFRSPTIHDAFMGVGDYSGMAIPNGRFGLGFRRFNTTTGDLRSFGHAGVGGSTAVCDTEHNFSIAVTVNKMGLGGVTGSILQLVCSELNIELNLPLREEFSGFG